jgi:hypothetical protein
MFNFFSGQSNAPQRVPTDRLVPVGFFYDTIIFSTFVLYTLFVFDDVLDPQKLRTSLEHLVSRPAWKKLGAGLRRNVRTTYTLKSESSPKLQSDSELRLRNVESWSTTSQRSSARTARPLGLVI